MYTILSLGTLWFWLFIAIVTILIIWAQEGADDDGHPGTVSTLICLGALTALFFLGCKQEIYGLFNYIVANPLSVVFAFFAYVLLGSVWSVVKWYFFVLNIRDKYKAQIESITKSFNDNIKRLNNNRIELVENKNRPDKSTLQKADYDHDIASLDNRIKSTETELKYKLESTKESYMPEVKKHKSLILTWMFYWPFSAIWTVVNDPIRRVFQRVYVGLETVYQRITDRAFAE